MTESRTSIKSPKLMIAGCSVAVTALFALVALLWPSRHSELSSAEHEEAVAAPDTIAAEPGPSWFAVADGASSRPAAGASIAMLVEADAAYDRNDFQRARDLYLDLLLSGGDFGEDGDAVVSWAHGKLALAMARMARDPEQALLDEPALLFAEEDR